MISKDNQPDAVEKNVRHNLIFNAADGAVFWFANNFFSPSIILPVFITHFTQNPLILALIPFVSTAGYYIPQLFTSRWVERAPVKKIFPVNFGFFLERLPIALLVPSTYFFAHDHPQAALVLTLLLFSWHTVGTGFVLVGWQTMISKVIPTNRRGRFFGVTNFIGSGTGILGAMAVTALLSSPNFPMGYVWAFAVGAALNFVSWWCLSQTRETPDTVHKAETSFIEYYKNIPRLIQGHPNFLRYLISQVLISVGGMANTFLIVYAIQKWSLSDGQAAAYTIVLGVGQAVAYPLLGWLADRRGHKLVLEISLALNIFSLLLAIFSPLPIWFYAVFFLRGVNYAGTFLSSTSITMEFSAPEDRPTFIGLANTIPGISGGIAPILAGWLALSTGYPWVFACAAAVGAAGFITLRWFVLEPRFHKTVGSQAPAASLIDG